MSRQTDAFPAAVRCRVPHLGEFNGFDALQDIWAQLLGGKVALEQGVIVTLT